MYKAVVTQRTLGVKVVVTNFLLLVMAMERVAGRRGAVQVGLVCAAAVPVGMVLLVVEVPKATPRSLGSHGSGGSPQRRLRRCAAAKALPPMTAGS